MSEIWKPIDGTNGMYEVSNTGKVRSNNYLGHGTTKELALQYDKKGYIRTRICKGEKRTTIKVHREVAKAFIPNPESKKEVNHINGVKDDNRVENLEWVTASENTKHAYNNGLKEKTRERCKLMGKTVGKIALDKDREKRKTPVIATNLGNNEQRLYSSQSEAAVATHTHQANIYKVLCGERKSTNGYSFKYATAKGGDAK